MVNQDYGSASRNGNNGGVARGNTRGRMRFGAEGWYETGDIRMVDGGRSYGPEEPGEDGVEFLLVSCGGPVNLHWADLEPAPNGPLLVTG